MHTNLCREWRGGIRLGRPSQGCPTFPVSRDIHCLPKTDRRTLRAWRLEHWSDTTTKCQVWLEGIGYPTGGELNHDTLQALAFGQHLLSQ